MRPPRFVQIFKPGILGLFLFLATVAEVNGQSFKSYPAYPFPLDIKPVLSGNFGEIRYNHFHSGIDITTFGKTGIPVHAVQDGFVSRIRISPFGYGLAVYIDHLDGYTTVYAHLSVFNTELQKFMNEMQEHLHSYAVDIYPEPGKFSVKKGDIIAYSGNSGSSTGPHLHFEVRESKTEFPVNPLLFHLPVQDNEAPKASKIYFYRADALWRGAIKTESLLPGSQPASYKTKAVIDLTEGEMAIGLAAFDQLYSGGNHNGIYEIMMDTNNQEAYHFRMDRFSFDDNYFVNAHIDYRQRLKTAKKIMLCYRQPGDMAPYYPDRTLDGTVSIKAGKITKVHIQLIDIAGNKCNIFLNLRGRSDKDKENLPKLFSFDKPVKFQTAAIEVHIPALALYSSAPIDFAERGGLAGAVSKSYRIGSYYIPIQHYFDIIFKNPPIPDSLKDKTLLIRIDHKNRRMASRGHWVADNFYASSRAFGTFYLAYDQKAPNIIPLTKGHPSGNIYRFKLSDNLAGVQSYEARLDGRWILAAYSGKSHVLSCPAGIPADDKEHILEIIVKDYVGNQSIYKQAIKNYTK